MSPTTTSATSVHTEDIVPEVPVHAESIDLVAPPERLCSTTETAETVTLPPHPEPAPQHAGQSAPLPVASGSTSERADKSAPRAQPGAMAPSAVNETPPVAQEPDSGGPRIAPADTSVAHPSGVTGSPVAVETVSRPAASKKSKQAQKKERIRERLAKSALMPQQTSSTSDVETTGSTADSRLPGLGSLWNRPVALRMGETPPPAGRRLTGVGVPQPSTPALAQSATIPATSPSANAGADGRRRFGEGLDAPAHACPAADQAGTPSVNSAVRRPQPLSIKAAVPPVTPTSVAASAHSNVPKEPSTRSPADKTGSPSAHAGGKQSLSLSAAAPPVPPITPDVCKQAAEPAAKSAVAPHPSGDPSVPRQCPPAPPSTPAPQASVPKVAGPKPTNLPVTNVGTPQPPSATPHATAADPALYDVSLTDVWASVRKPAW